MATLATRGRGGGGVGGQPPNKRPGVPGRGHTAQGRSNREKWLEKIRHLPNKTVCIVIRFVVSSSYRCQYSHINMDTNGIRALPRKATNHMLTGLQDRPIQRQLEYHGDFDFANHDRYHTAADSYITGTVNEPTCDRCRQGYEPTSTGMRMFSFRSHFDIN